MKKLTIDIEKHYQKKGLIEEISNRLKNQGLDLNSINRSDIAGVDEFHVRGAMVSKELANEAHLDNLEVLDIGCGLGGPSRMLAEEFNCFVTGIDLSKEFIKTAKKLSQWVGLEDKTKFIVGDATHLPFKDQSFDVVWTQHVQMNIPNKEKFYAEIERVLKPNGLFLYYDILKNQDNTITFPMPWASTPNQSFLIHNHTMNKLLLDLGLEKVSKKNQTKAGINFLEQLLEKIQHFGPPNLGLNVLMGESTITKLSNLLHHLKNNVLMLESGMYKKPH